MAAFLIKTKVMAAICFMYTIVVNFTDQLLTLIIKTNVQYLFLVTILMTT